MSDDKDFKGTNKKEAPLEDAVSKLLEGKLYIFVYMKTL